MIQLLLGFGIIFLRGKLQQTFYFSSLLGAVGLLLLLIFFPVDLVEGSWFGNLEGMRPIDLGFFVDPSARLYILFYLVFYLFYSLHFHFFRANKKLDNWLGYLSASISGLCFV